MEILLPTAEKQNDIQSKMNDVKYLSGDIHNIVTNTYYQVRDLNTLSSSGTKPYNIISFDNVDSLHEQDKTKRTLLYSITGKGFIEKFLNKISVTGTLEVVVDGAIVQNLYLSSNIMAGFQQAQDGRYSSGRLASMGESNHSIKTALKFPHSEKNTNIYNSTTAVVSEIPILYFERSFEVYFTPSDTSVYKMTSYKSIRGGVY